MAPTAEVARYTANAVGAAVASQLATHAQTAPSGVPLWYWYTFLTLVSGTTFCLCWFVYENVPALLGI